SLLDFARVGQGPELALEPTDLAVLTSNLVESFRTRVEQAGLELIVDCPANADLVHVDRPIWEKIVVNLVSHAFNTTFEGSLAVSMEWQHDRLVVLFRDTGIGIPAEDLPRIFEPFHRIPGRRSRTCEGTTIGLALVQELVRHHGGKIDVWSEEGRGTTFRVVLPTGRRPLENSSQRASEYALPPAYVDPLNLDFEAAVAASAPPSRATFVQGHILVVDHDAGSRGYLYRLLCPSFRVSVAENGSAALAEVRRAPPDLILSDVMIPVIDGPGFVRSLRDDPQTAMIPVILFSNRTGEDGIASCGEMGADDYLVGPFSAGKLLARVRVQLQLSRVRRAAADAARDLARSRATLVQKLEAKKRELESFSDSASRELRLPVQHDSGLVAILEREFGTSLDYRARNYLLTVTTAAREVETLFGNLLSFSRISQSDVKRTFISLRSLVQEAVEQLSERSDNPPTQWILGTLPSISVDPEMLRVVLIHLISNALKFSSLRSKRRIEIGSTHSASGSIVFYVRDNGVGFDMERAEQLFGVFQRLHTHEEFEGAGIGLAIVNRIIQRHGGRVWATSTAGEGAAFYCSLPNAVG
ncbi:MAG TPA: ATP-binding protein, partial [Terriglobia bacterium]|nr:ATP-binding protein [Terriglobia bacterium]